MGDIYIEKKPVLPASYVAHIEKCNGWEGDPGEELGYVVLWDKESIQDRWEAYEMTESLGDCWFPFGSDGGGEILCFDLRSGGDAVYHLPFIGMAAEEAIRHGTFAELSRKICEKAFYEPLHVKHRD